MDAAEKWRDIPGYEGSYQASSLGRVRSLTRKVELNNQLAKTRWQYGKVLRPASGGIKKSDGKPDTRLAVVLRKDGRSRTLRVHSLVALAFLGPKPDGLEVAHINGINTDNRLPNLRYVTHAENEMDKFLHGTRVVRTICGDGHALVGENVKIQKSGQRTCVTCSRARSREYHARRRNAESI